MQYAFCWGWQLTEPLGNEAGKRLALRRPDICLWSRQICELSHHGLPKKNARQEQNAVAVRQVRADLL